MEKYWEGVKNTEEIDRGLYIILPLRYQGDFQKIPFSAKKTNTDQNNKSDEERDRSGFDSDDFLEILSIKCRSGEFVKRCMLEETVATVYKGNIIKNLIMDCQSYTKYRPNETTGGIFVSWRRKEELPTGA